MLPLLVQLLIVLLIAGIAWWIITLIPLPQPFATVAQVIVVLILLVWLIDALSPLALGGRRLLG